MTAEQFKPFSENPHSTNELPSPEETKLTFEEHLLALDKTVAPSDITYTEMFQGILPVFQENIRRLCTTNATNSAIQKSIGRTLRGDHKQTIRLNNKGISDTPSNRSRFEHMSTPRAIKNITSGPDNLTRAAGDDTHKD